MKKQRVLTVLLTLTGIVSGLFGPALIQAGATSGPTAGSPGAVVMREDLTTKVAKLFALDFRPAAPDKPLITTVPYTADELRKIGGNRITQAGGKFFVTTKKINPATKKPLVVPIETYVAQLNDFERFLNKLG